MPQATVFVVVLKSEREVKLGYAGFIFLFSCPIELM